MNKGITMCLKQGLAKVGFGLSLSDSLKASYTLACSRLIRKPFNTALGSKNKKTEHLSIAIV